MQHQTIRTAVMVAATLLTLGVRAHAEESQGPAKGDKPPRLSPEERFTQIDADGSGSVSRDEFIAGRKDFHVKMAAKRGDGQAPDPAKVEERAGKHFDKLDADHNGSLSQAEFAAGADKHREMRGKHKHHKGGKHDKGGDAGGGDADAPPAPAPAPEAG